MSESPRNRSKSPEYDLFSTPSVVQASALTPGVPGLVGRCEAVFGRDKIDDTFDRGDLAYFKHFVPH